MRQQIESSRVSCFPLLKVLRNINTMHCRSVRPLLVVIVLAFLAVLFMFSHDLPRSPLSPVCSHRASVGGGATPSSLGDLTAALQQLASEGILCYDVDITQLSDGTPVVGHPSEIEKSATHITLPMFFTALAALPAGATATLELKGALRGDAPFALRLAIDAKAAAVKSRLFVNGLPAGITKEGLQAFTILRDRAPPGSSRCGLPVGWESGRNSNAADFAAAIESVAAVIAGAQLVMPSSLCLAETPVRVALNRWIAVTNDAMIQTWIIDSPTAARDLLRGGKEGGPLLPPRHVKFVSNEPIQLARSLQRLFI